MVGQVWGSFCGLTFRRKGGVDFRIHTESPLVAQVDPPATSDGPTISGKSATWAVSVVKLVCFTLQCEVTILHASFPVPSPI